MKLTRRKVVLGALASAGLPDWALAQNAKPLPRIAMFNLKDSKYVSQFSRGMRELGYVEGRDFLFEWPDWKLFDRSSDTPLAPIFREIISRKPDILLLAGTPYVAVAKRLTSTIPIVMATVGDPVGQGFVASLAHPGGNITGFTIIEEELAIKRLEMLHELLPKAKRFAVLHNPSLVNLDKLMWSAMEPAARRLGVQLVKVASPRGVVLEATVAEVTKLRPPGVLIFATPPFTAGGGYEKLAASFLRHRIPAIHGSGEYVSTGGLASFGVNILDNYRQSARFVDRILKGAKPGDLPIEQPTKFELAINLKTAKAIGFTFPKSFIARADEVIE